MLGKNSLTVSLFSETIIPTIYGEFTISVFRDSISSDETVVMSTGLDKDETPLVRVHSECLTGEVFGSLKCDCREQLDQALKAIQDQGCGAVIYLRQEGRGIGLGNKIKAYELQNSGADTVEANEKLGFANDLRDFGIAAEILKQKSVTKIILNTNNPEKIKSLEENGIEVASTLASHTSINRHNSDYLKTKLNKLGHNLSSVFSTTD